MESVLSNSNSLRHSILPQVEQLVLSYREGVLSHKQEVESVQSHIHLEENKLERLRLNLEKEQVILSVLKTKLLEMNSENSLSSIKSLDSAQSEKSRQKLREYEQRSAELTCTLRLYESRLGLSLKRLPNSDLRLSFEYIKPCIDESEHSITIAITSTYRITSCVPHLTQLPVLLKTLNKTNDFSRFVKELRKAFVGLYSK